MNIQLVVGNDKWIQAAAFFLRFEVFVQEQGIPPKEEFDAWDTEDRFYFLLMDKQSPIATMRYQKLSPTLWNPDRFCVTQAARRSGNGKKLYLFAEEYAITHHCLSAQLSAELTAVRFYESLGYQTEGRPYLEDGLPCIQMTKQLSTRNKRD